jgi:hypothetical protein
MLSLLPHDYLAELQAVACEAADLAARGDIAASRLRVERALARAEALGDGDPWSTTLAEQYRRLLATYAADYPADDSALEQEPLTVPGSQSGSLPSAPA